MEKKHGYSTTTYKFHLCTPHIQWLYETKEVYNLVLEFYYTILQKEPALLTVPKHQLLRELELLTVGVRGQSRETIKYLLPYEKVPLYFRRAAINAAIGMFRSYTAGKDKGCEMAKAFHSSPVFYKGMYKDFAQDEISLKLWNGGKWVWEKCKLDSCGRIISEREKLLSPILKLVGKKAMLHVPVVKEVEDIRTVRERIYEEEKICSAAFPGNDCMAVLTVLDKKGKCLESLFIRGGKQLQHEKKKLLNRICKNRESMGFYSAESSNLSNIMQEEENKYLKVKLKNVIDTYCHRISRQIVEFCEKRKIIIIVVPNYSSINFNDLGYLPVTGCDWLGRRIIKYLRYKAFARGIAVSSVSTKNTACICYACGQPVKRFNKNNKPGQNYYGGKNYICPNGHKGNSYFNSAMNIGCKFLKSQGEILG